MDVEVFLTSSNVEEDDVKGRTAIVIDVLRACSTISTALKNGARAVVPVLDMAQAGKIASNLDRSVYRLGGERGGEKIEGYDLGNSPLEYTEEVVSGRDIILNTTNGTKALARARSAKHLIAGSLLNASRVIDFVNEAETGVTIICAGREDRISLEDTLCAGLLLHRLWDGAEPEHTSDAAHAAHTQYLHDQNDIGALLRRCNHARRLIDAGFGDDVDYCLTIDALPVLPYYTDNRLILYEEVVSSSPPKSISSN